MKILRICINGFVLAALAFASAGCTMRATTVGLSPEYPKSLKRLLGGPPAPAEEIVFTKIDTVEPAFRWKSFPRKKDLESEKQEVQEALSRIKDVTYDLKIFRAENDYPAEMIYSRQGLPEAYHKIETPLEACTKYFWSIRARFKLDNKTRVTGWSVWSANVQDLLRENPYPWFSSRVPNPFFYWFQTPCPEPESEKDRNSVLNPWLKDQK